MKDERAELPGSSPKERLGDNWLGPADPQQELTVTILLRRPASGAKMAEALLEGTYQRPSREAAERALAANPNDIAAVESFVRNSGLTIAGEDAASRSIKARGSIENLDRAFGVEIGSVEDANGARHVSYRGSITLPESVAPVITAVLGLDQRPVAKARFV